MDTEVIHVAEDVPPSQTAVVDADISVSINNSSLTRVLNDFS